MTAKSLIAFAYALPARFVLEAPSWADGERFDVVGSSSEKRVVRFPEMLRKALEDRFGLRAVRESKVMAVCELVREKPDGPLGPQLKPSTADCSAKYSSNGLPPCYLRITSSSVKALGRDWNQISLHKQLQAAIPEVILDKTGLSGRFDMMFEWVNGVDSTQDGIEHVSVFTAMREQLGLKLVSARAPVDVVVVKSLDKPSPD